MKILKKIKKLIVDAYLCIKYPFLYPRNRFTDLHYNNWKIVNFLKTWMPKTVDNIIIKHSNNESQTAWNTTIVKEDLRYYTVSIKNENLMVFFDRKCVFSKPLEYFGQGTVKGVINSEKQLYLVTSEDFVRNPDSTWIISIVHAKWLYNICQFFDWIHRYPMQWLHFIPTHTELDAMPQGWREAFGLKMCSELKEALKKAKMLKDYRIIQIKEKYGTLRWYDGGGTEETCKIIDKYEDISYHTCIVCGEPATYISRGYISPYCPEHIGDREHDKI